MIKIQEIRARDNKIVVLGNHEGIIQSVLDFDYLSGKKEGSVVGVITGRRGVVKYFWGRKEILIPTLATTSDVVSPRHLVTANFWLLNLLSGRRTLTSTQDFFTQIPHAAGAALFAENVPELHSQQLIKTMALCHSDTDSVPLIVGPASVGLLVPKSLKLGPIGGITPDQINDSHLTETGGVAVLSASGGMTNELINIAISSGHRLSFALSFGGDRFPILSPRDAFILAEEDPSTKAVLYYGELGGEDEYELVKLKEEGKFTKTVIAHIAGTVASLFPESPQFGHAKAKADKAKVTALAKREVLAKAGFLASNSFSEFINLVLKLSK
ncbi:MAG: hypothetical protein E6R05_03500 [Candidatus Moraniibacteriota bacterium]|nr:MAG: hypothetical protein E6R05_03500 [Candidatus Moranbacteria bacterium]